MSHLQLSTGTGAAVLEQAAAPLVPEVVVKLPVCAPHQLPVQRLLLGRGPCRVEGRPPRFESARQLARLLLHHLEGLPQETFLVVLLDLQDSIVGVAEVALGGIEDVAVDARLILGAVLSAGAADFVAVHNHVRAAARPTREDDELTQRLVQLSRSLGVTLVDHVIAAAGRAFSYRESGRLGRLRDAGDNLR